MANLNIKLIDTNDNFILVSDDTTTEIEYGQLAISLVNTDYNDMYNMISTFLQSNQILKVAMDLQNSHIADLHNGTIKPEILNLILKSLYKPMSKHLAKEYLSEKQSAVITLLLLADIRSRLENTKIDLNTPEHYIPVIYSDKNLHQHVKDILLQNNFAFISPLQDKINQIQYQRADLHVFTGPILSQCDSAHAFGAKIKDIIAHNEKYCIISASGTAMRKEDQDKVGEIFTTFPPLFITTRDEESYLWLKPFVHNLYNGICTAWLVDRTIHPGTFQLDKPFFISSWYTELDPVYSIPKGKDCTIENLDVHHKKTYCGLPYDIARHLNFLRPQQKEIGGKTIVRTIQNLNTRYNHINFAMPQSFISFNVEKYLDVVKSSEFTISDRVHACVVSLACGRPARFLFSTPRAGIFTRMGLDFTKNNGVMYPIMDKVDHEMYLLQQEIRKYLG